MYVYMYVCIYRRKLKKKRREKSHGKRRYYKAHSYSLIKKCRTSLSCMNRDECERCQLLNQNNNRSAECAHMQTKSCRIFNAGRRGFAKQTKKGLIHLPFTISVVVEKKKKSNP